MAATRLKLLTSFFHPLDVYGRVQATQEVQTRYTWRVSSGGPPTWGRRDLKPFLCVYSFFCYSFQDELTIQTVNSGLRMAAAHSYEVSINLLDYSMTIYEMENIFVNNNI